MDGGISEATHAVGEGSRTHGSVGPSQHPGSCFTPLSSSFSPLLSISPALHFLQIFLIASLLYLPFLVLFLFVLFFHIHLFFLSIHPFPLSFLGVFFPPLVFFSLVQLFLRIISNDLITDYFFSQLLIKLDLLFFSQECHLWRQHWLTCLGTLHSTKWREQVIGWTLW